MRQAGNYVRLSDHANKPTVRSSAVGHENLNIDRSDELMQSVYNYSAIR